MDEHQLQTTAAKGESAASRHQRREGSKPLDSVSVPRRRGKGEGVPPEFKGNGDGGEVYWHLSVSWGW